MEDGSAAFELDGVEVRVEAPHLEGELPEVGLVDGEGVLLSGGHCRGSRLERRSRVGKGECGVFVGQTPQSGKWLSKTIFLNHTM